MTAGLESSPTSGSGVELKIEDEAQAEFLSSSRGKGMTLEFKDLTYSVKPEGKGKDAPMKKILRGVSGFCRPGEVLALMGPSGAGKTTLLNLLASRKQPESGEVLVNGRPPSSLDRRRTGYVMQEEMFLPHLSVKQQLEFTALLRLPAHWSHRKKMERCREVIGSLSLDKCVHTKLGLAADWGGGVSGGEKKRVSIGSELLPCPRLLFLDEPTSGLDSTSALALVRSLTELARSLNATVVCSVHQPSSQLFQSFDRLLLLMNGRAAFFGPSKDLQAHLSQPALALPCPEGFSMAEHIINIAKDDSKEEALHAAYLEAQAGGREGEERQPLLEVSVEGTEGSSEEEVEWMDQEEKTFQKWLVQFRVLLRRAFVNGKGDVLSLSKLVETAGVGILSGLVVFQRGNPSEEADVRDLQGVLVFMLIFDAFSNAFAGLTAFSPERAVIIKERASKAYPMSAYFLAKSTAQLALSIFLPILFACILYPLAGLELGWEQVSLLLVLLVLHSTLADAIGLLVGAVFMDIGQGIVCSTIIMVGFFLFGGFLVGLPSLAGWVTWLSELSMLKHSYNAIMAIYVAPNEYLCSSPSSNPSCQDLGVGEDRYVSGETLLEQAGLTLSYSECCLVLLAMQLAVRVACYCVLRWSKNLRPEGQLEA